MEPELQAFVDAWADKDTRPQAKGLAIAYYNTHKQVMDAKFDGLTLEQMVSEVSHLRASGREEDRVKADMWLLVKFPPQHIVGVYRGTP